MLDCIIFVYTPRDTTGGDFWQHEKSLNYIATYCNLIENHGRRITENLHMVHPSIISKLYDFVFILFDDCKLVSVNRDQSNVERFPLDRLLYLMDHNRLTIVSPMVIGANTGGGQKFRTIMQTPAQVSIINR